jgi:hypothetical protein
MPRTSIRGACSAAAMVVLATGSFAAPVLDSSVTILQAPGEALPLRKATADLQRDFAKVFGSTPRIVTQARDAGPLTVLVGTYAAIPAAMRPPRPGAPESFSISLRGTLYAVYQFSQEYLGVDPMYYWTDAEPRRRVSIELPAHLSRSYPAPLFKYRGFFINDEDQLTGWASGERTDHAGISLEVWDRIFETILRLKGNMVVPGTWIFPTDPQVKLVGERGLIMTQHHAIPLGVNVARWPEGVPYDYSTHPEILERAWTNAVASYDPHQEILWSVGLRGLSDTSYASMDKSVVGDDKRLGMLISRSMARQIEIVRAAHPDAQFVTNLWQEGARLMQSGELTIPPSVTKVWADTGYGLLQDEGRVAPGNGAYYHVAMLNGRANQLSEMVSVDRIHAELGRYIKADATGYLLVNTSDIRAVAMTARAVMDVAWGGLPAQGGSAGYYRDWAAREFGADSADAIATLYGDYFKAFSHIPAGLPGAGMEYGDQLFHSEAQMLLLSTMVSPPYYALAAQSPKWTPVRILGLGTESDRPRRLAADHMPTTAAREVKICGEAQARWDDVWKRAVAAEALVVPERRPYYEFAVLTGIAMNQESNRVLSLVSKAVLDYRAGDEAQARAEALEALAPLDEIRKLESGAEYGKWKNWYRGEWLDGIDHTRELVQDFVRYIDDPDMTLPLPVLANGWQGYYHIMRYEGDQTVDVH